MKNIIKTLSILLLAVLVINVKAENYSVKELIPIKTKTTVNTDNFKYIDYNVDKNITMKIRNMSDEEKPVSITILLFDKDKKNIGTINYCDNNTKISPENNIDYTIEIGKEYFGDGYSIKDIAYTSILSDNINCNTGHAKDFVGMSLKDIVLNNTYSESKDTRLFIDILLIVLAVIVFTFIYNYLFTNTYQNINGDDTRRDFKNINDNLKRQREYEKKVNPPKPKEIIKTKSDKVIEQEKEENSKSTSDLKDLYK